MTVYRIARRSFADLSGSGGTLYSGRWHKKGYPIIYAAGSVALAALEYAVHASVRPADTVLMEIVVPKDDCITIEDRLLINHHLFAKVGLKRTVPFFFDPRIFN